MVVLQKKQLYSFLKTASGAVYGSSLPVFDTEPVFSDDVPGAQTEQSLNAGAKNAPFGAAVLRDSAKLIAQEIAACKKCALFQTRKNTVSGVGALHPVVMVIGEAPGKDEDEQGFPFVGKAGQLLDKMLAAIFLSRRTNCFIANTIKCRPPENRDPAPEEQDACFAYLQRQIQVLKPSAILVLGRIALQRLLGTAEGITRIHGQFFSYEGTPLLATFHPSYLLRAPEQKRAAWEDLKKFREKLLELCPDYDQTGIPL
jgi:DNA polymerase